MVRGIQDADGNVSAQSPGFLLFSCHFGQVPERGSKAWKYFDKRPAMVARNQKTFENLFKDYNLHAHIYQCRNLTPVRSVLHCCSRENIPVPTLEQHTGTLGRTHECIRHRSGGRKERIQRRRVERFK